MTGRRVLVAQQPAYLPWPGYFARLVDVEEMVLLDHVQFAERGRQHRNRVRGPAGGGPVRLTVPVRRRFGQPLREARIADPRWARRHLTTLRHSYGGSPAFARWLPRLSALYARPFTHLAELNEALVALHLEAFGLDVRLVRSSTLPPTGAKTVMLANLAHRRGADTVRVGVGALNYLDLPLLADAGLRVQVARWDDPRPDRIPGGHLAALDILARHEPGSARAVLEAGASLHDLDPDRDLNLDPDPDLASDLDPAVRSGA
ncbi:WbqC family protein [Streptomyces sp. 4N509B]|uniref:WbqC family protein n=1 Tax=Streptomyces sp. 4N509B TaxID=3457413 RepID=UPI003FD2785F